MGWWGEFGEQCWVASCIVASVTRTITNGKYELFYEVVPDRPTLYVRDVPPQYVRSSTPRCCVEMNVNRWSLDGLMWLYVRKCMDGAGVQMFFVLQVHM